MVVATVVVTIINVVRVAWPFILAALFLIVAWDVVDLKRKPHVHPRFRASRALGRTAMVPWRLYAGKSKRPRWRPVRVHGLGELLALTYTEFEHAVATILSDRGYTDVVVCGGSGDLGVDIACWDQTGSKVVVQCKRYSPGKSVGSADMQRFVGMIPHHGASSGMYVTTSSFTKAAQDLARQYRITLIDGPQLSRMVGSLSLVPVPSADPV